MNDFITLASSTADGTGSPTSGGFASILITILPLVLMFGIMYLILIRPQKKKEKQVQQMRNNLQIGDEVVTAGGIIGLVVSIKEDTVIIETGTDRSKVRIKRWAIQNNLTVHDEAQTPALK